MSGSSGGSGVLQEFLVAIGFSVDRTSADRAKSSLADVAKQAISLGLEIKAAALAVTAAVAVIASKLEDLYFVSRRTGAAAENVKALGFAFSQIGLSAGEARNTIETLARTIRTNPGNEGLIQSLGVSTRSTNGSLRDTTEIYNDLIAKLKEKPYFEGNYFAGALGIDEKTFYQATHEVDSFSTTYKAMLKAAGFDAQDAAKGAHGFMVELRTLGAAVGILQDKVASAFTRRMADDIRRFREWLVSNFGTISQAITWVADKLLAAADVVTRLAQRTVDAVRDIAGWYGRLDEGTRTLITRFAELLVAWRVLNTGFLTSPIGVVVALGAAIFGLWEDYKTWKEGGESLINWGVWEPQIKAAWSEITKLGQVIRDDLGPAFTGFLHAIVPDVTAFFTHDIPEMVHSAIGALEGLVHWLTHVGQLFQAIRSGDIGEISKASAALLGDYGIKGADPENGKDQFSDNAAGGVMRNIYRLFGGGEANTDGTPGSRFAGRLGNLFTTGQTGGNPNAGMNIDRRAAAKEAYDFWANKGFTPAGSSAMVAAEQQESRFDPRARGDVDASGAYTSFGLYQHHNDRIAKIYRATGINIRTASADQQREAMYQEMALGLDPQSGAAFARIKNARNAQEASDINVDQVERPLDRTGNKITRGAIAMDVQRKLGRGADGTPSAANSNDIGLRDIERMRGLSPGALRGLEAPAPLGSGANVSNNTTHGATLNQQTTINVAGGSQDLARQIADGVRTENQNAIRNLQGAAR